MLNLETVVVGDFVDVAFNVALFYSILRTEGCNPFVRDGGLYLDFINSAAVKDAGTLAALYDPSGEIRLEYARSAWTARRSGTEVVELG